MKILICDIQVLLQGHNLGHIQNLIRYLEKNTDENEYIFLLNPEAASIPSIKTSAKNIKIVFFSEEEFRIFYEKSIVTSTLQIWKYLEEYVTSYKADKLILMVLDLFQHAIIRSKIDVSIFGVLFQPYTRLISDSRTFKSKVSHKLRKLRKYLTVRFMLRQKRLKKVFIFNDYQTVNELNRHFSTSIFTHLPDPIYNYPNEDQLLDIRKKHNISEKKTILLCFGMIDSKKNVAQIINAAKDLSEKTSRKLCILIVGKVRTEYERVLTKSINAAKMVNSQLQIAQLKGFVTDAEMESYVKQSDWISLAYVNFYSSSGVVGLAARHNKPILATKFGVIGQQTKEYGLGISVDARKTAEITDALETMILEAHSYPKAAERFVDEHSPESFIKCLLQTGS